MNLNSPEFRAKVAAQAEKQRLERIANAEEQRAARELALVHAVERALREDRAAQVLALASEIAQIALPKVPFEVVVNKKVDWKIYAATKTIARGWPLNYSIHEDSRDDFGRGGPNKVIEDLLSTRGDIYHYTYISNVPHKTVMVDQYPGCKLDTVETLTDNAKRTELLEVYLAAFVARHGL